MAKSKPKRQSPEATLEKSLAERDACAPVHAIHVFQDPSGAYRVWPPVFVTREGCAVELHSWIDVRLSLRLIASWGAGFARTRVNRNALPRVYTFTVPSRRGVYFYRVMVGRFCAVGNSDPSIIVD